MKRTKTLILALLVALAAVPSLHAQDYVIGSSIYPEEVADGMEVVFEGRSVTTSRGSYLGPFKDLEPADIGNLPKLIRPGSDEVPLEIVWVLHLADEPNAVTGEAQYYLQNKETGEYIATGSFDNDPNTRANRLHMVDDIAEAAPFCFHYSSEGEPYGSVNYGSLSTPIDWIDDPTCITILCIDESIPNGRAFISNEESGTTCSYFEYLDTNVWNIHRYYVPSGARDFLQIYLDNLPANWEGEYAYGTDPGFINNEEKVIQYTELVFNAINNIATMSDEECKAAYDEIMELVEFFDDPANSVQIKDGGYYYITAGYDAFQQSGKTNYGWYGPINYMDQVGWKEIEPTGAFIWKFTQVADSAYMIENLGCGLYADSTLYNAHLEVLYMSDLPACRQFVTKLNHAGNYRIQWDGGVQAYHQMDHGNGEGTGSTIVLHDQDGNTSPSTWILRKVPEDVLQQVLSTLNHDRLELYLSQNTDLLDKYTVGNRIGQLNNQAIYDEIKAAYETAVAEVGNQHTEEEYGAYLANIKNAIAKVDDNSRNQLTEGYYRFYVANPYILQMVPDDPTVATLAWTQHHTNVARVEWSRDNGTADYIWKVTFTGDDDGHFYIQNTSTKQYISSGTNLGRGVEITSTPEPETVHYLDFVDASGIINVYNTAQPLYSYHALSWDNANNGTLCYAEGDPSKWYMEPVDAAEAEKLIAEALNRNRIDTLRNLINTAESKLLETDVPVYDYDDPVATDASQLYTNAEAYVWDGTSGERTSLANLIDGDVSTIFHSRYNSLEPIDDYHYLRVYAPDGLPDKFGIHWAKRCFDASESNNAACRPTKIAIALSNDGETWEHPDTLTTADGLPTITTDTFYTSKKPIDGTGYTYFIMKVLEVNDNFAMSDNFGHPFFTMSEYNLYPYTGSEPASQVNYPEVKAIIDELKQTIADTEAAIETGVIGDDVIPTLQAAYDKLLEAWIDTTEFSSLYNDYKQAIALTEEGDEVGFVDSYDAVDEFEQTIDGIYATIVPPNFTKAELTAATDNMNAAFKTFMTHVNQIEPYVWYVIRSGSTREYAIDQPVFLQSTSTGTQLKIGNYPIGNEYIDVYAIWRFVPVGDGEAPSTGQYAIQNLGTGQYWGAYRGQGAGSSPLMSHEPVPYNIYYYGMGCFALQQEGVTDPFDRIKADGTEFVVLNFPANGDHQQAWRFDRVDEITETVNINHYPAQSTSIITLPWATTGDNAVSANNNVSTYAINSVVEEEGAEGEEPSYTLTLTAKDEFEAGEPFVIVTNDEPNEEGQQPLTFNLPPAEANAITDTSAIVSNGLVGTLEGFNITGEANLYFDNSELKVGTDAGIFIAGRSGYIDFTKVKDLGGSIDKTISVNGVINNIGKVEITGDANATVDVYSIDGVLLKRNVKASEATKNLAKGIYIVGKKKILVK